MSPNKQAHTTTQDNNNIIIFCGKTQPNTEDQETSGGYHNPRNNDKIDLWRERERERERKKDKFENASTKHQASIADPDQPSAMDSSGPNSDPRIATPIPSDWDHAKTLVALSYRKDRKKPKLWALKFILMPALLMLYTIGFFLGYEGNDDDTIVAGDYRLFQGQEWAYPAKIKMGASDPILLEKVADFLAVEFDVENSSKDGKSTSSMELQVSNATSSTELVAECQGQIDEQAANEICVYLQSDVGYELYFGGKGSASPSQPALAGAQYSINSALMNISGINELYPVIQIQQTPQLLTKESVQPDMAAVLVPACMYVLSALVCSLFLVGPVVYEKINGIAKSYLLVGVKMKTYLLQWLLYYALNGTLLALLMTLVCIFFNLMPLSNFGLVFLSNYLGLVQMFSMLIIGKTHEHKTKLCPCLISKNILNFAS